jgi:hypothetical protein
MLWAKFFKNLRKARKGGRPPMKKLMWIVLIMVLGLSGCATSGTATLIKADWNYYWSHPKDGTLQAIKQDWTDYWN